MSLIARDHGAAQATKPINGGRLILARNDLFYLQRILCRWVRDLVDVLELSSQRQDKS